MNTSPQVLTPHWLPARMYGSTQQPAGKKRGFCLLRINNSGLFDLREIQLHGRGAPENLHRHVQAVFIVINALHNPVKVVERPVDHAHHFARLEQHLRPRLVHTLFDATQDLVEARLESGAPDALLERLGHPVLEVRIGVHHVPPERHHQLPCRVISFVAQASPRSSNQKNIPATTTKMNTTSVVMPVSWRPGHTILRNSMRASSTNWRNSRP